MSNQYYVQDIATNYLKNVIDDPKTLKIHSSFLGGADIEQFTQGFLTLLATVRVIYADIIRDPASFGMLLKEKIEDDPKNPDYTNSNASFVRVPNLLLMLGAKGVLQPDVSLSLDGAELIAAAKELKVTSMPFLLAKLKDYGFDINGLGKTIKAGDIINVSFPDERYLITALKAMADALMIMNNGVLGKSKNYFYMLHYGMLDNEKVKAPKLDFNLINRTLDTEKQKCASQLDDYIRPFTKPDVRMGGFMRNDWSCTYTGSKDKKVVMTIHVNQDKLSAKLNLKHIGEYICQADIYPEHIRETIRKNGFECGHCNEKCAGGFPFTMDGKAYNKCRCGSFYFHDPHAEDLPYLKELLERELSFQ